MSVDSGRRSPFCRSDRSDSVMTTPTAPTGMPRASTPTHSPAASISSLSPLKAAPLSPEKTNPFTRRPSQLRRTPATPEPKQPGSPFAARTSSPFVRPGNEQVAPHSPNRQFSPAVRNIANESGMFQRVLRSTSGLFDGTTSENSTTQGNTRPNALRTPSQTPTHSNKNYTSSTARLTNAVGGYNHVPQPLLRSMRESFEVLDSSNSGSIDQASLSSMLEQMGLDNSPAALQAFFPRGHETTKVNLARYLDSLSGPLASLSPPDELQAAFEAFDVDDSGQIDVATLRQALLNTAPEPGEAPIRLSEGEVDAVMSQFSGRRAFGAKGLQAAKGKGEVFRYRDFMSNVSGGSNDGAQVGVDA
ncbi:calmodulin [Acrodontium crateriforme]|uniref:Calmodulin n=1 Tax=Acrodontium crateriforme TaxID=150365 RepID=A0AAQ3M3P3_9PEZI|nr:calmodulin [Acrodontium crateriforme]